MKLFILISYTLNFHADHVFYSKKFQPSLSTILHSSVCYAVPVCRLWAFWKSCVKTDHEMRSPAAGSIPHHTPLLWKFTRVCPRLQFIEAINPSVFIPLLSIALSPSPLQGLVVNSFGPPMKFLSHSHAKLVFKVAMNLMFTPPNVPVLLYIE